MAREIGFWKKVGNTIQPVFTGGVDLLISGTSRYLNFNSDTGETGYGLRDNSGTIEYKNSGGSWTAISAGGGGGTDDQVAAEVPFTPAGNIAATDVQAALEELDSEKAATASLATVATSGDYNDLSNLPDLTVFDEVEQYANLASFPGTGDTAKFYLAQDTGTLYRWNGSAYAVISAQLALGSTSTTAHRGDHGAAAYTHSQATSGNPHNVSKSDVGLGNVDNTSDLNKPISTATQSALDAKAPLAGPTFTGTTTADLFVYDAARGKVTAGGNLGATETINFNDETNYTGTLDSNITFTFSNATSGDDVTLFLSYDGTAQRTITWPTITWLDNNTGAAPTTPAASGNVLVVTVRYIGTTYYGSATGNYAVYS